MQKSTPRSISRSSSAKDPRAARLKAALKANIAKRKAQARVRDAPSAGQAGDDTKTE